MSCPTVEEVEEEGVVALLLLLHELVSSIASCSGPGPPLPQATPGLLEQQSGVQRLGLILPVSMETQLMKCFHSSSVHHHLCPLLRSSFHLPCLLPCCLQPPPQSPPCQMPCLQTLR